MNDLGRDLLKNLLNEECRSIVIKTLLRLWLDSSFAEERVCSQILEGFSGIYSICFVALLGLRVRWLPGSRTIFDVRTTASEPSLAASPLLFSILSTAIRTERPAKRGRSIQPYYIRAGSVLYRAKFYDFYW